MVIYILDYSMMTYYIFVDGCVKVYTYSENDAGKVEVEQDLDVGMIEIEEQ